MFLYRFTNWVSIIETSFLLGYLFLLSCSRASISCSLPTWLSKSWKGLNILHTVDSDSTIYFYHFLHSLFSNCDLSISYLQNSRPVNNSHMTPYFILMKASWYQSQVCKVTSQHKYQRFWSEAVRHSHWEHWAWASRDSGQAFSLAVLLTWHFYLQRRNMKMIRNQWRNWWCLLKLL